MKKEQVYMSKSQPDTLIHWPKTLADLKKVCKNHGTLKDCMVLLNGPMFSRKTVTYRTEKGRKPWEVVHHVDGTVGEYTDKELDAETNVVKAIRQNAFIVAMSAKDGKFTECKLCTG